jgi:hypothetical protein
MYMHNLAKARIHVCLSLVERQPWSELRFWQLPRSRLKVQRAAGRRWTGTPTIAVFICENSTITRRVLSPEAQSSIYVLVSGSRVAVRFVSCGDAMRSCDGCCAPRAGRIELRITPIRNPGIAGHWGIGMSPGSLVCVVQRASVVEHFKHQTRPSSKTHLRIY